MFGFRLLDEGEYRLMKDLIADGDRIILHSQEIINMQDAIIKNQDNLIEDLEKLVEALKSVLSFSAFGRYMLGGKHDNR